MAGSVYKRCPCGTTGTTGKPACKKVHGTWWFRAEGLHDATTGRRKQPSQGGFPTKAAAEAALADFMGARNTGRLKDDQGLTVGQWFDRWLAEGSWELLTVDTYRTHIESIWRRRIGHIRLRDLRRHHVEDTLRDEAVDKRGKPRMPRTLRSYRATLRASLTAAKDAGLIVDNPAVGNLKALPAARRAGLNMWQPSELRLFLAVTSDKRDAHLWRVAAFTGLRRAELCGLRWQDVDLASEHPGVTVRQTVPALAGLRPCITCGGEHRGCFIKPSAKSQAGERWVPLVREAVEALKARRTVVEQLLGAWGAAYQDHDLVFAREDGTPLAPTALTIRFKTMVEAVRHPIDPAFRLPVIRPHDMRHGAASLMIAAGVPIETVSLILGHSSPIVTRQIYTHVLRGPAAAALEAAAALVRGDHRAQSVHSRASFAPEEEVTEPRTSSSEALDLAAGPDSYCITNSVR